MALYSPNLLIFCRNINSKKNVHLLFMKNTKSISIRVLKTNFATALLLIFVFLYSTRVESQNSNDKTAILEINQMLDEWHGLAAVGDTTYFDFFDNDSFYLGTDDKEVWSMQAFKDFALPHFRRGSAWNFKTKSRNVYLGKYGHYAWIDETLDTWMGLCRGTAVLEKQENSWVIMHYSLTVLVPNKIIKDYIKLLDNY